MHATSILIVDDDATSRIVLERMLQSFGHGVRTADSGEAALESFKAALPDVVLLDIQMPGIDGYETAKRMKVIAGEQHVPILMLTGLTDDGVLEKALQAGADDYLSKPYKRGPLAARVEAALRSRSLFSRLDRQHARLLELTEQSEREQRLAQALLAGMQHSSALDAPYIKYRSTPLDTFNGDLLVGARTPDGLLRILLADFAGHGLTAAIGAMPMVDAFQEGCRLGESVERVLRRANEQLRGFLPRNLFLAVCVAEIDPDTGRLSVWNAGMPAPIVRGVNGGIKATFPSQFFALGVVKDLTLAEGPKQLELEPGDHLYLYSDGLVECVDADGKELSEGGLLAVIGADGEPSRFEAVLKVTRDHRGAVASADDETLVEVCYSPQQLGLSSASAPLERPSRIVLELGPSLLKCGDAMRYLEANIIALPAVENQCLALCTIASELLNNAVDHGLLALPSSLKANGGFASYYQERERRLAALRHGLVRVELEIERRRSGWRVTMVFEDSGAGYDLRVAKAADPVDQPFGRGLAVVRGLCTVVEIEAPGNRVRAVYEWSTEARTETAA